MKTIQCALCKSKEALEVLYPENFDPQKITAKTFSARRIPDRSHYRFVRCKRCMLIFSNPILEEEKIAALYKKSTFTFSAEADYLKKTYWKFIQPYLPKKNIGRTKLLEIGCSNGFFLEEVYSHGITDIYGVEPGKQTVAKAPKWLQKKIIIDILRPKLFPVKSFDTICCFHTLDHIVSPDTFVKQIYTLLKKGGKAFFVVHNTDGLSVKLFGERSPIFDIEHIYLFNKKTLTQLFEQEGFTVRAVVDIKNRYPLQYWSQLLPLPSVVKRILLRILVVSRIGLIPLSISAGNIGIVAEKKS